jgi:hypothetical protein
MSRKSPSSSSSSARKTLEGKQTLTRSFTNKGNYKLKAGLMPKLERFLL